MAGEAGFLNYSLTAVNRPEEVLPPQAVIQAVPQSDVGQVVVFDGSASSGQAPIVTWRWDFGDGGTASGAVVQHLYSTAGTFTVSLTVTDQRGQSGVSTQQMHILALPTPTNTPIVPSPTAPPAPLPTPEQPTATPEPLPEPEAPQASITGPAQGYIAEPVTLDASASQPGSSAIVSFAWRLGNGIDLPPAPESSVSVTYNRAGDYEVIVLVAAADGLTSYATTRINIDARLDTDVWTLSQYNQTPLLPGTAVTLQFKQGELAGFAGCNTYTGEYTAVDNGDGTYSISLGQLTTSRLACPVDILNQESAYLSLLQQATTANIQENSIVLSSPAGELLFYLVEDDELNPR